MRQLSLTILIFILFTQIFGQTNSIGDIIFDISTGTSFSNFINSEAPHKINVIGSDINPIVLPISDITLSPAYTDYQTSIVNDVLIGISIGTQLEYFYKDYISFSTGFIFSSKGINLNYSNTREGALHTGVSFVSGDIEETLNIKIKNNYLVIPFRVKKYLKVNNNIFISGGCYIGYLTSSKFTIIDEKKVSSNFGTIYNYSFSITDEKDEKKEFTTNFDLGLTLGTGCIKNISERLYLQVDLFVNIGVINVDKKYNNEFSVTSISSGSNFYAGGLRATNYYGLNSNSKNVNMEMLIGIKYKIND